MLNAISDNKLQNIVGGLTLWERLKISKMMKV